MAEMAELDRHLAHLFTHSELSRVNQVIGMIWSVYPDDAELDEVINLLEAEGLSRQNRARLRAALKASRLVSQGKRKDSFRINPREAARLSETFAPVTGRPKKILVNDAAALIPDGTLPLDRRYIAAIVRQVNEGYVAGHYDSAAVMLRRLVESLLVECYVRTNREASIRVNGNLLMLDGLITTFAGDAAVGKSRNLISQLRKVKEVGDNAAHSRNYVTKKVDIEDIKLEARRCVSELAVLAGL